jgi:hypothetical protein
MARIIALATLVVSLVGEHQRSRPHHLGSLPGPTMYMSGPFIQHTPYPGTDMRYIALLQRVDIVIKRGIKYKG